MPPKPRPFEDRFWAKVVECPEGSGCWLWTGSLRLGYGMTRGPRSVAAHRVAYEFVVGLIPPGLVLDHLCRVRRCVNPAHLEPVTQRENVLRAFASRVHCKYGHPLDGTRRCKGSRARYCKTCARAACRRWAQNQSEGAKR